MDTQRNLTGDSGQPGAITGAVPPARTGGQPAGHPSLLVNENADAERPARDQLQGMYAEVGFHDRQSWKSAPAVYGAHSLKILNHPVMEDWERPYMAALAAIATRTGGQILEVGFGMGISAGYVSASPNVTRHIIIEANHDVAEMARKFAADAAGRVVVLEGLWEEVIDQVPDSSCGGVLFDAYPLDESEVMNQAHFARTAYRKLQPGGHFTYFSDETTGYRPEHFALLLAAGFREKDISHEIIQVSPPADCDYWKSETIVAPILVK